MNDISIDFSENLMHLKAGNTYANVSLDSLCEKPNINDILVFSDNVAHNMPVFAPYYNDIAKALIIKHSFFIPA